MLDVRALSNRTVFRSTLAPRRPYTLRPYWAITGEHMMMALKLKRFIPARTQPSSKALRSITGPCSVSTRTIPASTPASTSRQSRGGSPMIVFPSTRTPRIRRQNSKSTPAGGTFLPTRRYRAIAARSFRTSICRATESTFSIMFGKPYCGSDSSSNHPRLPSSHSKSGSASRTSLTRSWPTFPAACPEASAATCRIVVAP